VTSASADPGTSWPLRVLLGTTLADKLAPPDATARVPVHVGALPDAPGRPEALRFPVVSPKVPFPTDRELGEARGRGVALHFFANHELLALELMALALVRFPDAPQRFRAGLVAIMQDEQRHLQAYLARMEASGVVLGDVPVNRYFWDALARVEDPLTFVTGLSLTFEQANLDFAAHYAAAFRRVGDVVTAGVLDEVLADEIRHVRHGVNWFDAWRSPPDLSRWEAFVAVLPPPLTPARAKGSTYERAPRHAAGLDHDFVDRLAVFGASRGRPPRVHGFFPGVEADVAARLRADAEGRPVPVPPGAARTLRRIEGDLASALLFLATRDDVVLLPRAPSPTFLADLARAGFDLPEIVEGSAGDAASLLVGRTLGEPCPWGVGPGIARAWAPLAGQLARGTSDGGLRWEPAWSALYDKGWSAGLLATWAPDLGIDPSIVGQRVESLAALDAVVEAAGPIDLVAKAPWSTAGRGHFRVGAPGFRTWVEAVLMGQGSVLVEPWLTREIDLSVQLDVTMDGGVRVQPWGRFLTDDAGRYKGAVLGRSLDGLDALHRRAVSEAAPVLVETARRVGAALHARGYAGPAGIDALIYRAGDGALRCKPLVEINPRRTMGRVARAIERRVVPGRVGLWVQRSRQQARNAGFPDLAGWAEALRARAPLTLVQGPLVASGALFTSDPANARDVLTVLVVAEDLAASWALFELRECGCPKGSASVVEG
jgi:uncharacterized ferritin-like protein (DUF455 family)